jgi:hypothetical protein
MPKPKPKSVSTVLSPNQVQADLRFNAPEPDGQIAKERRAECIALLRELIETVAGLPTPEEGGADD